MASIDEIPLQEVDFRTSQSSDWLDGLPIIGRAAAGGIVAGAGNVGNGGLTIGGIAVGTRLGVYVCVVTGIWAGLTRITVTDPGGGVVAEGVVGLPLHAGGVTLTLAQGSRPFAIGDSFAISMLPDPVDLTGLLLTLRATANGRSSTVVLEASSAPADGATPTIFTGGPSGTVALRVLRSAMIRCPPGDYPYGLFVTEPVNGLTVPAFAGILRHRATPTLDD